jgi:MOSC domain-containing protein YiiM
VTQAPVRQEIAQPAIDADTLPMPFQLISLNISLARPMLIDGEEVMTGIRKRATTSRVDVGPLGLTGDEQADLSVHGGLSKAVYAYPHEHYPFWQTVRAQTRAAEWDEALAPGSLGENLTLTGLAEDQAWIGDVLRFPHCELAISEPRFPCFKLNAALGFNQASKMMVASGWCGFYLAVRIPGTLAAGDGFEVIPGPREVGITELFRARATPKSR